MRRKPGKRAGPSRRKGDLAIQIVVGIIVIMSAILVGGLLTSFLRE